MNAITRLPRRRRLLALLAAGSAALLAAGCGQPAADEDAGKELFVGKCGSCHILADAGTKGVVGPNLDDAFRAAREDGFEDSQFRGVVHRWIRDAQPPMPQDLVTGQDAEDVAAYVASVAGVSPESPPSKGTGTPPGYPEEETPVTFTTD